MRPLLLVINLHLPPASPFGAATSAPAFGGTSVFGASTPTTSASAFGGASVFGGSPSASVFGSTPASTGSVFGAPAASASGSPVFRTPASNPSASDIGHSAHAQVCYKQQTKLPPFLFNLDNKLYNSLFHFQILELKWYDGVEEKQKEGTKDLSADCRARKAVGGR